MLLRLIIDVPLTIFDPDPSIKSKKPAKGAKGAYHILLNKKSVEYESISEMGHTLNEEVIKRVQSWMMRNSLSYESVLQSKI